MSESTKRTDYRSKWVEYAALDIHEYWIVDPIKCQLTLCILDEGRYQETVLQGDSPIQSPTFPTLNLTSAQILEA